MTAVFVTATGTDIGKTFVVRGMIRALRGQGRTVDVLKPVITGFDPRLTHASDTGRLLSALELPLTPEHIAAISPFRFRDAVAPDLAARREGTSIDFAVLTAHCRAAIGRHKDVLIIEGVGGVMVPLDDRHTVLDWMIEVDLPAIVVAGSYLGTLSHTLSALEVLDHNDLKVMAVVVSETPGSAVSLADTVETLRRFVGAEVLALPRLPDSTTTHPVMTRLADLM